MNPLIREVAKLGVNVAQSVGVKVATIGGLVDFPVPPNSSMRKTSSKGIRHFYLSGITCSLPIVTMALSEGIDLASASIFDFGCGVGRQLWHLTRQYPKARFFACDVDETLISFIRKHYPEVKADVTQFLPPLPYADQQMDVTYSVSTFSHISIADQISWLKELYRITKKGGYCFLTTEGYTSVDALRKEFGDIDLLASLKKEGILYREYAYLNEERKRKPLLAILNRSQGITGSYGSTIISPEYIRRAWTEPGFRVANILPGVIDGRQDLVVLQRPVNS